MERLTEIDPSKILPIIEHMERLEHNDGWTKNMNELEADLAEILKAGFPVIGYAQFIFDLIAKGRDDWWKKSQKFEVSELYSQYIYEPWVDDDSDSSTYDFCEKCDGYPYDYGEFRFKIKGCRGWHFSMWISAAGRMGSSFPPYGDSYDDETEGGVYIKFFARHKSDLDKFKPSRSTLIADFTLEDIIECLKGHYSGVKENETYKGEKYIAPIISSYSYGLNRTFDMLETIKNNPLVAFWICMNYGHYCPQRHLRLYYWLDMYRWYKSRFLTWSKSWLHWFWLVIKSIILCSPFKIEHCVIDDNGPNCYPRFTVRITFRGDVPFEYGYRFAQRFMHKRSHYCNVWYKHPEHVNDKGRMMSFILPTREDIVKYGHTIDDYLREEEQ